MIRKLVLTVAFVLVAGCTPAQLTAWQSHTGITLTAEEQAPLLALDDVPYRNGRLTIDPDGTITEAQCEEPAAPEAHRIMDPGPALQTWRAVTCARGWDPERIAAWEGFIINDVIIRESMGCFNLRRGPSFVGGTQWGDSCTANLARQGRHSDAGYGQVIALHYRPNGNYGSGWLCAQEGLCSAVDIIATPTASMTALVALVERSGKQPWCYNGRARSFHPGCRNAP